MTKLNEKVNMKDLQVSGLQIDKYMEEIRQYLVSESWSKDAIENAMKVPLRGIPEQLFRIEPIIQNMVDKGIPVK